MKSLQINYLAVLVAAIVTFILGAIWYITFSDAWMKLAGLTQDQIRAGGGSTPSYIISFATYILGVYAISLLFKTMNVKTAQTGLLPGLLIEVLLIGGNIFTNNAYEMKPIGLSVLNAGFSSVSGALMGAILGAWRKYK